MGSSETTQLETWEDDDMLLFVAKGYGHFVRADDPQHRVELPVFPVRNVIRHPSGVVVLGDFTHLCGLDGFGVAWVSPRLGSDWLDSLRLDGDMILGRGSVAETGGWAPFHVSVQDGRTETEWGTTETTS